MSCSHRVVLCRAKPSKSAGMMKSEGRFFAGKLQHCIGGSEKFRIMASLGFFLLFFYKYDECLILW